jgi:hypothetical protein
MDFKRRFRQEFDQLAVRLARFADRHQSPL